jgi:hypothetical protein
MSLLKEVAKLYQATIEKLCDHIDAQAAQIETLKEKLISERALRMGEYGYLDELGNRPFPEEPEASSMARRQLKAEMPEVDWDE